MSSPSPALVASTVAYLMDPWRYPPASQVQSEETMRGAIDAAIKTANLSAVLYAKWLELAAEAKPASPEEFCEQFAEAVTDALLR